jgi:hypothetical protein
MHSGKTTLANELVKHGFTRIAFADPVKDISAMMLNTFTKEMTRRTTMRRGWPVYTRETINEIKGHPAIRKLLQLVGTELGRNWFGPDDVWINAFEENIFDISSHYENLPEPLLIVNDDCRFPNEAARLRELGFTIIKLVRDHDERMWSIRRALERDNPALIGDEFHIEMMMHDMLEHPSETNVDLIEADINVASESVEQLQAFATIIATEGLR